MIQSKTPASLLPIVNRRIPIAIFTLSFVVLPAVSADGSTERIKEILEALERRSDGLKDIGCQVTLLEEDNVNLTTSRRSGNLRFVMTKPNPQFFITFDETVIDDQKGQREWFVFDGRWLFQGNERIKQVTKQEVAKEGETLDFFDLEKAPFPIPFGHKKEKILRQFDVTLAAPLPGDPPKTDHLICTPKEGSSLHGRYQRLEFFVKQDVHLPARIVVIKDDGDVITTADFPSLGNQSINKGLSLKDFKHPREWKDYEWVVEGQSD